MTTRALGAASALVVGMTLSGVAQAALYDRGGGLIYDSVLNITWLQDANYAATELSDARVAEIVAKVNAASPSWLGSQEMAAWDFYKSGGSYWGYMTWWGAMAWADQLSVYDSVRGVTWSDWRLPTMTFPAPGYWEFSNNGTTTGGFGATGTNYGLPNPTGGWGPTGDPDGISSELGWMFYHNLGNLGYCTPNAGIPGSCTKQTGWGLAKTSTPDNPATPETDPVSIQNLQSSIYWSGTGTEYFAPFLDAAWGFDTFYGRQDDYDKGNQFSSAWAVRPGDVAAAVVPLPAGLPLFLTALASFGLLGARRRGAAG